MNWNTLQKPAEMAESRLIDAILDGHFPIDSNLPSERELATQIGVTRPTLREALQRMARDGWIEIRHGKPTRVRNYWVEGTPAVLTAIAATPAHMPPDFVRNLLAVRTLIAPAYTRLAFLKEDESLRALLEGLVVIEDSPQAFADADWSLHHALTIASGNPVFTLILNGFAGSYGKLATAYFSLQSTRDQSRAFYGALLEAAATQDADAAEAAMAQIMDDSTTFWLKVESLALAQPEA